MAKFNRLISEYLRVFKCKLSPSNMRSSNDEARILELKNLLLEKETISRDDKVIWMFWDSGLDTAPDVVKLSYQSWVKLNPDYKVTCLDVHSLKVLIGFDFFEIFKYSTVNLGAAGKSDLLRLYLLNQFGGVWADATTFCKKPLSMWLTISKTGFFCFREKTANDRQLVSWFLASEKNHPIIKDLLEKSLDYLLKPRIHNLDVRGLKSTYLLVRDERYISKSGSGFDLLNDLEQKYCTPYFWMFYLFNEVIKEYMNVWDEINKLSNQYAELNDSYSEFFKSVVSKQTYRTKYTNDVIYKERVSYILKSLGL
ncbi:capsular polysaccharide synthesis protein [Vibrio rumoiensis]|uniref:capsular polysaccharide synthesis protein n=1 Tax=Vibrio rumoiensis TaxID=76258 RepID=UPI000B5C2A65|nr:capsular polysaccharide synthesis protein [Vibrio rumoiensis]